MDYKPLASQSQRLFNEARNMSAIILFLESIFYVQTTSYCATKSYCFASNVVEDGHERLVSLSQEESHQPKAELNL